MTVRVIGNPLGGNVVLCQVCLGRNPWRYCKGPTSEVAHQIRMWHRHCRDEMQKDFKDEMAKKDIRRTEG